MALLASRRVALNFSYVIDSVYKYPEFCKSVGVLMCLPAIQSILEI